LADRLALTISEAAESIGVSERTVRSLVARREIPHVRVGRRVLIPCDELRVWLAGRAEVVSPAVGR
jgi:excisionase family DNA binding protein